MPTLTTNCSNNYGPISFPEKLIPLMILNALTGEPLPVYGDGSNVRDWLYVDDHCAAIRRVLERGRVGETYNIGGGNERANIDVVHALCDSSTSAAARRRPAVARSRSASSPIGPATTAATRSTHENRARTGLDAARDLRDRLRKTVHWYLDNTDWVERVADGSYRDWVQQNYSNR